MDHTKKLNSGPLQFALFYGLGFLLFQKEIEVSKMILQVLLYWNDQFYLGLPNFTLGSQVSSLLQ